MKRLVISLSVLLAGCCTTKQYVDNPNNIFDEDGAIYKRSIPGTSDTSFLGLCANSDWEIVPMTNKDTPVLAWDSTIVSAKSVPNTLIITGRQHNDTLEVMDTSIHYLKIDGRVYSILRPLVTEKRWGTYPAMVIPLLQDSEIHPYILHFYDK